MMEQRQSGPFLLCTPSLPLQAKRGIRSMDLHMLHQTHQLSLSIQIASFSLCLFTYYVLPASHLSRFRYHFNGSRTGEGVHSPMLSPRPLLFAISHHQHAFLTQDTIVGFGPRWWHVWKSDDRGVSVRDLFGSVWTNVVHSGIDIRLIDCLNQWMVCNRWYFLIPKYDFTLLFQE